MHRPEFTGQAVKPLGVSIKQAAEITGESQWQVKQKLRDGTYSAKKSGRRTIIVYASIEAAWNSLPAATFKPSTRKHTEHTPNLNSEH
jgi:hypothetical protein